MPRRKGGTPFGEVDQRDRQALFRQPLRGKLLQDLPRDGIRQSVELLRGAKIESGETCEEKEDAGRLQGRAPRARRDFTTRKPTLATTAKGAAIMSRMDQ